jgi:hypothetical protein
MVVVVATPGHVHLAMLVVPMPGAIEVAAVGVAVHVAMMMAVPVVPIDVYILRRLHDAGLDRSGWLQRRSCGCGCGKCQSKASTRHRQYLRVRHEYSPFEHVRLTSVHAWWIGEPGLLAGLVQAAANIRNPGQVKPA